MIRHIFLAFVAAILASPLIAEELPITDRDRAEAPASLARRGFNCPKLIGMFDEGEGPLGKIGRIKCQSENGKQSWDFRTITPPNGPARIEPW